MARPETPKTMAMAKAAGEPPDSELSKIIYPTSIDDARLEVYRDIRDRDVAGRGEFFILEGSNSIENLVNYGRIPLVSVLLSEKRIAAMADLLRFVLRAGVPVYALPQTTLEQVVGFNFHRGVLGCGRKLPSAPPREFLSQSIDGPIVLCEQMNNLDNVGAVFRNAAAFGARAVLFDARSGDPYYRKSLRVSGGHALAVPFSRSGTIRDVINAAKHAGFVVLALVAPRSDKCRPVSIRDYSSSSSAKVAILVGAEGPGLSEEAIALADARLTIPMASGVDSLNVATSLAVALFHLTAPPKAPTTTTTRDLLPALAAGLLLPFLLPRLLIRR